MQRHTSHYRYVTGESPASTSALIPCFPASLHPAQVPLIGLAGHLPAFIVLAVKGFRLAASAAATTAAAAACLSTIIQLRSLTKVIVILCLKHKNSIWR